MEIDLLSTKLLHDAKALLETSGLIPCLEKYGQVVVTGSYRYGLMTVPDIDICVVHPDAGLELARAMVCDFIDQAFWRGISLEDFAQFPRDEMPAGIYLGLKRSFRDRFWKIDVWLLADISRDIEFNEAMSHLTEAQRATIMQIKHWRRDANLLSFPSKLIYDAVLQERAHDVESFRQLIEE